MTGKRKKKVLMVSDLPVETALHVRKVMNTETALNLACNALEELLRFPDSVKSQAIRREHSYLINKNDYEFGKGNLKYRFLTAIDPPPESDHNVSQKEQEEPKQEVLECIISDTVNIQNPHRKVINIEPFNTFSCDNPDETPTHQPKFPILAKIWKKLWS